MVVWANRQIPNAPRPLLRHGPSFAQDGPVAPGAAKPDLALALLQRGLVRPSDLVPRLGRGGGDSSGLSRLLAQGQLSETAMLAAAAGLFGASRIDPMAPPPDPQLIDRLGLADCLQLGLLPWRRAGAVTYVATARPEEFSRHRPRLEQSYGPVAMVLAPRARIEAALLARRGARLAHAAETRPPQDESCRGWGSPERLSWNWVLLLGLAVLALLWPLQSGIGMLAVALLAMACGALLRLCALAAVLRPPPPDETALPPRPLPVISIIVALHREGDIAPRLVRRLSRLDYPRELLEVLLAVEVDDSQTRGALDAAMLPGWMRVVVAPAGRIKTKPRALNIALDHARGEIIGVYDAEDAPEPDQLRKVVDHFRRAPPEVACLQGVLDYYNPRTNWLSRCFTLEYATWFRLLLPGVARLGLAVPLGGTTLFLRRAAVEGLGAWDAHNVTEDADLGLRLFRHGLRTELLDSVTLEEANCASPLAWIKQRSRWIKGFMMTWMVHMRAPRRLWRQLGPQAFCGFQVMLLASWLQNLLAPLIWSFWLLSLGLPHPLLPVLPRPVLAAMLALFLLALAVDCLMALVALRRSGQRLHPLWCLTLPLYFPLATLAAYKALWEVLTRPFYWDKTAHGSFDPPEG